MSSSVVLFINLLSASTLAAHIVLLGILIAFGIGGSSRREVRNLIRSYRGEIILLVALAGTLGSLFLSEAATFLPCSLCWWQRIFLYPIVIVMGLALFRKEVPIVLPYINPLASLGLGLSIYNHYLQLGGTGFTSCATNAVDCAVRYVWSYGYITIPLMSATAFAIILLVSLIGSYEHHPSSPHG